MFWKRKPEPIFPEPMIMGRDFFAENLPTYPQTWAVYNLKDVSRSVTTPTTDDNAVFWCSSKADATTLVEALDRITEATIASA